MARMTLLLLGALLVACDAEPTVVSRTRRSVFGLNASEEATLRDAYASLHAGRRLDVRVVDRGRPVSDAIGTCAGEIAVSTADGLLRFTRVPGGDAAVDVTHGARIGRGTVGDGATGTVALLEPAVVSGIVVDARGRPLDGVIVSLYANGSRVVLGKTTEGAFEVRIPGANRWERVDLELSHGAGVTIVRNVEAPSEGLVACVPSCTPF